MSNLTKSTTLDKRDEDNQISFKKPYVFYRIIKRIMDIVFSALSIIALAPFLLIIALIIKLGSPGPVLFKQKRMGLRGKEIYLLKFRTMKINSVELTEEMVIYKLKDDPRITNFGRFLRKTSIDELPQLITVLKGDMSLIGPRPIIPFELEMSKKRMQIFMFTKPGISGIWQISGVSYDDMIEADLEYIRTAGLVTDLKILLKTFQFVLLGKGGY